MSNGESTFSGFTPSHRGGAGTPLVLLHGFLDTWRTWELVLPALERHHDVLALTLPGHAGGPPLLDPPSTESVLDAVEAAMDHAGLPTAHLVGNSLGGYLALALATRGRARSVVAFAPAGGWADPEREGAPVLAAQRRLLAQMQAFAAGADRWLATPSGRRRATQLLSSHHEHLPRELISHQLLGVASCRAALPLLESALEARWPLDVGEITCPVRIVWGTEDRLLPWDAAAVRFRSEVPHADWVILDEVGHAPQLDVPLEAAQLILGLTS